jgi:hypothetical protein
MVMVEPGSPVPLIVGVVSLVMRPLVGFAMVGADGAVVSIVTEIGIARLVLPVASIDVAERLFTPSGRGDDGVNVQFPDPSAVTVPSVFPDPSFISTVLFGSAVPAMVGVVSLVRYGFVVSPMMIVEFGSPVPTIDCVDPVDEYTELVSPATLEITGAVGGRESMVNTVAVGVLVFPARSVRVTE